MNCADFQRIQAQIDVSFDYYYKEGNDFFYIEYVASGAFSITQSFNPSKRFSYVLANKCSLQGIPQSVLNNKENWGPYAYGPTCERFKVKSLGYERQYMGNTPVMGTYTIKVGDYIRSDNLYCYLNGYDFYDQNSWFYTNLKPWDPADRFFNRNLSMWNTLTDEQKKIPFSIIMGFYDQYTGNFTPDRSAYGKFTENSTGQTTTISSLIDETPEGTATLQMTFTRGAI